MTISRRGIFGLFAGSAVAPLLPNVATDGYELFMNCENSAVFWKPSLPIGAPGRVLTLRHSDLGVEVTARAAREIGARFNRERREKRV